MEDAPLVLLRDHCPGVSLGRSGVRSGVRSDLRCESREEKLSSSLSLFFLLSHQSEKLKARHERDTRQWARVVAQR